MEVLHDDLTKTIAELNAGIHIKHIATLNLATCLDSEKIDEVISKSEFKNFDIIPVRDQEGKIVGIIERKTETSHSNSLPFKSPIKVSMLVCSESSVLSSLRLFRDSSFKLVLGDNGIEGIVTKSDLLKLPVRIVAFSFISSLESLMARLIEEKIGSDSIHWKKYISESRFDKIFNKHKKLQAESVEPQLVELMDFCDKRDIIRKHFRLDRTFEVDLKEIEDLRNSIAHSGNYISSGEDINKFILTIEHIENWLKQISNRLDPS